MIVLDWLADGSSAFELYSAINSGKPKDKLLAAGFRSTFSRKGVGVHFIGVW
jgi:hypothetical protein